MNRSSSKKRSSLTMFQSHTDGDFFLSHPNTVLLGFLGAVAILLLAMIVLVWAAQSLNLF